MNSITAIRLDIRCAHMEVAILELMFRTLEYSTSLTLYSVIHRYVESTLEFHLFMLNQNKLAE